MRFILLLLLISFNVWSNSKRADWDTINICHLDWGKSSGEQLMNKGFYLHVTQEIFKNSGYKVSTYIMPWVRCLRSVENETMDMVAIAWLTKENTKNMITPTPSLSGYLAKNYFITTKTEVENSSPESVKGLHFANPALASLPNFISEKYLHLFSSNTFLASQTQAFAMLFKERIDIVYAPLDLFLDFYNEIPITERVPYKVLKPSFNTLPVAPLFPKNSARPDRQKRLINDFNSSYRQMCLDGRLHLLLIEHSMVDGLLTHLQDADLPDILTHCTMLLKDPKKADSISVEELLIKSGHLH